MRHLVSIPFLFITALTFGQVNFQSLNWEDAKALAAKEKKFLFVDCYTDWCGWCKVMDKQTFPQASVSKFMNDNMVSVKIDMEKGFGIDLGHKYNITGYPTYLILDSNGDLLKMSMGYQEAEPFLSMLKSSTNPEVTKPLRGYSTRIPETYPEFLTQMWQDKKDKPTNEELRAFLDSGNDQFSEIYWAVLSRFSGIDDKYFDLVADNCDRYRALFGVEAVNGVLEARLSQTFTTAVRNKDEALFNEFMKQMNEYGLIADKENEVNYRLTFYLRTENWKKMMVQLDEYIKIHGEDDVSLNEYCWAIYESCEDPAIVKRAASIMKNVTEAHPLYAETDTYAALLYKSMKYNEAEEAALRAISLGKQDGSDVSSTEELLEKIRAAKQQ